MLFNSEPTANTPYSSFDNPSTPPRPNPVPGRVPREPRRGSAVGWIVFALVMVFGFVGLPTLLTGGADLEVYGGSGFTEVDGEPVVLVPYSRTGSAEPWADMFQLRLAAIELGSGAEVWDVQLSDDLARESRVLVAGKKYAYLISGKGLMIVAVADGEVVADGSDVDGLGKRYLAAFDAYGYDAETESVMVLDRDGGMNAIRLDTAKAEPVAKDLAAAWRGVLDDDPFAPTGLTDEDEALLAPDTVARLGAPEGQQYTGVEQASSLRIVNLAGQSRQLNELVFHEASILVDETEIYNGIPLGIKPSTAWGQRLANSVDARTGTVAGLAADLIAVRHKTSDDEDGTTVTVLSLKTGEVLDTVKARGDVGTAVSAPDGTTVFPMQSDPRTIEYDRIAVVAPSGAIREIEVGGRGLFGGL